MKWTKEDASNSNQIAITFRTNVEEKPIEWTPFTNNGGNVDMYNIRNSW